MKIFSMLQAKLALVFAALAFAGAASSQTMQVNGSACANASVNIAQGIVNLVVPQNCGGVTATAPVITAFAPSATGTVATGYPSYNFVASGTPTPTWSATGLPPGLSLSSGGVLTGTPTTAGTYNGIVVTATNSAGSDFKTIAITIDPASGPPVITNAQLNRSVVTNVPFVAFTYTASGSQTGLTWTVTAGALPVGLTLDSNTGTVSGTPTVPATYSFTVQAANGTAPNSTQTGQIIVSTPVAPSITAQAPGLTGTVGVAYTSYTFTATGTPTPTWSIASGALPAGLSLSTAGVLSGTPTAAGAATFTVKAANGTSPDATSASITITVSGGVACAPGNLSTDGFCMLDPSRSATKVVLATEPNRLSGPPAPFSPLGAYSAEVATSCAASNAQLGANQGVTTRWQHNVDWVAYRKGQTLEEFGIPPRHAITYRFVATNDIALPPTGEIQLAGGNSYPGSVGTLLSLSTTPCDFDVTMTQAGAPFSKKFCYSNQSSLRFEVTSGAGTLGYCKLTPGTTYYFNLRSVDTTNLTESCSNPVCGGIFQIR